MLAIFFYTSKFIILFTNLLIYTTYSVVITINVLLGKILRIDTRVILSRIVYVIIPKAICLVLK